MEGWHTSLWLSTAGIALATPILVWFAIGDVSVSDFYTFGPYDVGPQSGYVVGGVAAVVALASVTVLVLRARQGVVTRLWWGLVLVLVLDGALAAAGWRIATAGVVGANIGGAAIALVGPLLIGALLVLAVWLGFVAQQEGASTLSPPPARGGGERRALRWAWSLTAAAVLVAPTLYAVEYALSEHQTTLPLPDDSVGVMTPGHPEADIVKIT